MTSERVHPMGFHDEESNLDSILRHIRRTCNAHNKQPVETFLIGDCNGVQV